ncbi:MAG: LysR family transcriptional regulator [Prevotella sp.]|jgi:DNA-binding transcriptional LysR family regulator|nr:LysR family transcriptional regulator [Prevotella sp.]MCH4181578.1 LysR family transcriptional regulator [Prevotella sp.]MCH4212135.1 LysR family transcriptional regulator [Prevotella sp.]MCH4241149.1 LysR family transcriptional regulator [Prevotella sp.]
MIDIRLKVFRSVAENLSFTKASQELFISQPAISKHIRELEREYDTRLFDRMGNSIRLTAAGKLMLGHANRILEDYRNLDYDIRALQQKTEGELRISASTTISQYVIPKILAAFCRRYPKAKVSMLSGNSREIETALLADKIDLGMVEGVIRQPQLKYMPFMKDRLVAIVRSDGKWAHQNKVTIEELRKIPIVLREQGSGTLDVFERALHQYRLGLNDLLVEMYLGSTEGIKQFVESSDCMGIVSVCSVNEEILNGTFKVIEVQGLDLSRELVFVEKQGESAGLRNIFKRFILHGIL